MSDTNTKETIIKDIDVLKFIKVEAPVFEQLKIFDEEPNYLRRCIEIISQHVCKNCKNNLIYKIYSENEGCRLNFIDIIDKLTELGFLFDEADVKNYIDDPHPEDLGGVVVEKRGKYYILCHSNSHDPEFSLYSGN